MSRVTARSSLIGKVRAGVGPIGSFVMSTDAAVTAAISSVGFDFVVIDREHGPNDIQSTVNHVRAAEANGVIPIVRVPDQSPFNIQASLDVGAQGVVVPKVGTADQARALLRATRYEPGGRGMCPSVEGARWSSGDSWTAHRADSNDNVVLIPLIETTEGVDNLDEIAAIDGIDFVFFGLADLSQDIGIHMYDDADQLVQIWNEAVKVVHAHGALIGAPIGYGFEGGDFGTVESDFGLLKTAATAGLADARATLGSA